jgi:hypothetical protein
MPATATKPRVSLSMAATAEKVGGLSAPSKMPWYGFSTPAARCKTGGRLRQVAGSVCHGCYAHKGNYAWPNVKESLENRLAILLDDPVRWVVDMVDAIKARALRFAPTPADPWPAFRWHDSGDLQSAAHLGFIAQVARLTGRVRLADGRSKAVRHWLPTREYAFVGEFFSAGGTLPPNLVVRLSAHMIDGPAPLALARKYGLTVSGVHTKAGPPEGASACPAYDTGGKCLQCRNCWDKAVEFVSYPKH